MVVCMFSTYAKPLWQVFVNMYHKTTVFIDPLSILSIINRNFGYYDVPRQNQQNSQTINEGLLYQCFKPSIHQPVIYQVVYIFKNCKLHLIS